MDLDVRSLPEGITILTGDRGAGKTRTCQRWLAQAQDAGWTVAGIICPAVVEGGEKTGIDMLDAGTGEQRRLARHENRHTGFEVTDHWNFDDSVMEKGNEILVSAGRCDLLIVDELGPLEFHRKQGWVKAFDTLSQGAFRRAVVVIRPELLDEALTMWPSANIVNLDS
jgi:nucleoside-triphosphatase THEP1